METRTIKKHQRDILQSIRQKKVKEAFNLLNPCLKELQNSDLIDSHYNLELSYKSMLKYAMEGISDPEREKVYNHLLINLYHLTDQVIEQLNIRYSGDFVYETKRERNRSDHPDLIESIDERIRQYQQAILMTEQPDLSTWILTADEKLFSDFWLNDSNQGATVHFKSFFYNPDIPEHSKSLAISAILLRLMRQWDLNLILTLFDLTDSPDNQLQMRAIPALTIILYLYDPRLKLFPEISLRIEQIKETPSISSLFQSVFIQMVRTRETEKITDKMQNEIIPEVVKIHPGLKEKLGLDNLISGSMEDFNPEWTDFFADSPNLMGKLEELSKWQMEGADVFLSTFQQLKHFPFFNQVQNWFMPFEPTHPAVVEAVRQTGDTFIQDELLNHIVTSKFLCNSDKYSLILSIPHMPSYQRGMMGQMFKAEMEQMSEISKDEELLDPVKQKLSISNQYIQDLYRFFKVHHMNRQFEDIFRWKMTFYKKWFFHRMFPKTDSIRRLAEYFFSKSYFTEAQDAFERLSEQTAGDPELMQKIAYCLQKQNYYDRALSYYLKADLIHPDNKWTLRKIAYCYRQLKNPSKALEYYMHAGNIDPDHLQTQVSIGACLIDTEQFEEALKYYFKVEYLEPSNTKVWRPIGWCSFIAGKFDQAEKYYQKLLVTEKNMHDLLNLGHVTLCKGNHKEAVSLYKEAAILSNESIESFIDLFNQDLVYLKKHGVGNEEIPILLDQLRYSMEGY